MKKILLFSSILLLLASCTTSKKYVKYDESSASFISPGGKSYVMPLVTDIRVDSTRIKYQQEFVNNLKEEELTNPIASESITYMKNYALTQACFIYNADLIVCPIFDVKTSEDYKSITVTITGYIGRYSNFRTGSKEDFEMIRISEKEWNLQKLAEKGVILPPSCHSCSNGECSQPNCKQKETTPVNCKEVKFTIEKEK